MPGGHPTPSRLWVGRGPLKGHNRWDSVHTLAGPPLQCPTASSQFLTHPVDDHWHFEQGTPALQVGTGLGSPMSASAPALDGLEKSREALPSWDCPPTQDVSCLASSSFKRRVGGSLGPSPPSGHLGSPGTKAQGAVWI